MQIFYDFFPIIAFFVAYKIYDIYVATGVIIVAMLIQLGVHWLRTRTVNRMHLVSTILVLVFGGITLGLRNEIFIQWKPTALNWLFGLVFLASQFIGEKTIIQRMFGANIELAAADWRRLNSMWVVYFLILGAANIYVAYNFSENAWVNFKLFGMIGLTIVFAVLQGIWISRKLPPEDNADTENPPSR